MREISLRRKIHIISFVLIIIFMGLGNASVYAASGNAITLTGGNWAIGTTGPSGNATSGSIWTVTGSDDGSVNVSIQVTPDASCSWSAWETDNNSNTANKFILRENTSAGLLIKQTTSVTLKSTLKPTGLSGSYVFGLWFQAPPTGSTGGSCTFTVTLTASGWNGNYCEGTNRNTTRCLYLATASTTCAAFCATHGGDALADGLAYNAVWADAAHDADATCADMVALDGQGWTCVDYGVTDYAPGTIDSQHYYRSSGTYSTGTSLASWVRLCDCNF